MCPDKGNPLILRRSSTQVSVGQGGRAPYVPPVVAMVVARSCVVKGEVGV